MSEARDETKEAAIRREPDDDGLRLAYVDWLQQQGNARGELGMLQYLLEQKKLPVARRSHKAPIGGRGDLEQRERELLERHDELSLELDADVHWRLGFIDRVKVHVDEVESLQETLAALFAHPSARLLRTLELEAGFEGSLDDAISELLELERPESLRCFHLLAAELVEHDPEFPADGAWPVVQALNDLIDAVPTLEGLRVRGRLPEVEAWPNTLRSLAIETTLLSPNQLEPLLRSARPNLQSLELWFGKSSIGLPELQPILSGRVGKLRRLGLMNTELSDLLVPALAKSPLLKQLEWLSLAYGTLTDAGGQAIVDAASWFDDVATLDVSANFLSGDVAEAVSAVCQTVVLGEQRDESWGVEPAFIER
ncbi:MAG: TIGR02996 domain-containing protein [Archangium sp.]|nr:TIGR02996 domain-containing protein [Archangium sp.]